MAKQRYFGGWIVFLLVLLVLVGMGFLAWLPFWDRPLMIDDGKVKATFKTRVERLGPFGDMFGMLNPLVSTLALGAASYAVILQRREHKISEEDRKNRSFEESKTAFLNASVVLAQHYTSQYNVDPGQHNTEYDKTKKLDQKVHPIEATVKHKMLMYIDILERNYHGAAAKFNAESVKRASEFFEDFHKHQRPPKEKPPR